VTRILAIFCRCASMHTPFPDQPVRRVNCRLSNVNSLRVNVGL
jgi:hypothetical protein